MSIIEAGANLDKGMFWEIIEAAREDSEGNLEKLGDSIKNSLRKLTTDQIIDFENMVRSYMYFVDEDVLFDTADHIIDGCTDDGFEDFRCWLIVQGKEVYFEALKNPDSLRHIDVVNDKIYGVAQYCDLRYLAGSVYEEMAGIDLFDVDIYDRYLKVKQSLSSDIIYPQDMTPYVEPTEVETTNTLPSAEEIAKAYLEICDGNCKGDDSVGIPKCPFYVFPDIDENGNPTPGGCRLRQ